MNKAFKVVFNAVRGKYMVVNEKTSSIQRGAMKGAVVAAAAAVAAATAPQALAATYTAGHGTTDQYIAYTSSNPDTGYHKETATDSQGKTVDVAVKDGFTISMLTDNKRFPGSSNGYVIQVFGTEWDQNGTLSTFGHNVNTISSSYTETAIGGALNSTNASAFVGAVNSSYTTVSMSGDTNIKVGDSWVNGYNYFVTPETDSKLV